MSDILFNRFHYLYCARTVSQLTSPRIFTKTDFILPKDSVLHYIPKLPFGDVPDLQWYAIREYLQGPRRPQIIHVFDMVEKYGNVRVKSGVNVDNFVRWFTKNNRRILRIRPVGEKEAMKRAQQPVIMNYGFLPARYRYLPNPMNRLWRIRNLLETVFTQINRLQDIRSRNHFIFMSLPESIPTRQYFMRSLEDDPTFKDIFGWIGEELRGILNKDFDRNTFTDSYDIPIASLESAYHAFSEDLNEPVESINFNELGWSDGPQVSTEEWKRMTLNWFPDDESIFLAEFWKFLSPERRTGLFATIQEKNLDNVTIVFEVGDKYTCLNLGWLNNQLKEWGEQGQMGQSDSYIKMLQYWDALQSAGTIVNKPFVLTAVPVELGEETEVMVNEPTSTEIEESDDDEGEPDEVDVIKPSLTTAIKQSILSIERNEQERPRNQIIGTKGLKKNIKLNDDNDVDFGLNEESVPTSKQLLPREETEEEKEAAMVAMIDYKPGDLEYKVALDSLMLMRRGLISQAEHKRNIRLAESYKKIISPDGKTTLEEYMKVPKETLWDLKAKQLGDSPMVVDKSMEFTTLKEFDERYVQQVLEKETVAMVIHGFQSAGIAVTDLKRERNTNIMDDMHHYVVKLNPPYGDPSPFRFSIPVVDRNLQYRVAGTKYYQRKLKTDKPIRKISSHRVQLQTYYNRIKLFVDRSKKKVNDTGEWIINLITADVLSENPVIQDVVYGSVYTDSIKVPRYYSAIATKYIGFKINDMNFFFDYANREKHFSEEELKSYGDGTKGTLVGHVGNEPLLMGKHGELTTPSKNLGVITDHIPNINNTKKPLEIATLRLMKKDVPIAVFLGYLMGMTKLMETLGVNPRRRVKGTRSDLSPGEFEIAFRDEVWVFPDDNSKGSLIMGSLFAWRNFIKNFNVAELDESSTYAALVEDAGFSPNFITEFRNINDMLIDPISRDLLIEMNEPTEPIPLIIRAVEMLEDDYYPSEQLDEFSLIKGYERLNGELYRTIVRGVRDFRNQPLTTRARVNINPFEVISEIQKDPSVSLVEDSNPTHNMKEKENCTYAGTGGKSKLVMVKKTREFHPSSLGVRSEATVDSGDVGIIQLLTANPNLTSLRGTFKGLDPSKEPSSRFLSTATLNAPFATYDDPKRANFIQIQQSHVIETVGAQPNPISTGYDFVQARRLGDMFAFTAKAAGKVTALDDDHIVISYNDKNIPDDIVQIGIRYGKVTGHDVQHTLVTDLKVGDRFEAGKVVVYNKGFFKRNWRDPNTVQEAKGPLAWVTFEEATETFEDATRVSPMYCEKMVSPLPVMKLIHGSFDNDIHNLVNVGDRVDIDTPLCFLTEGSFTGEGTNFDQDTIDNLKQIEGITPKAGYEGVIERIEVVYFGDKEDMTDSLRKVVNKYDNVQRKLAAKLGEGTAKNGEIESPVRISGTSIEMKMFAIKVYISRNVGIGDGDKIVVGNQMKSVISSVIVGTLRTEKPIIPGDTQVDTDIEFSSRSSAARIVPSVERIGGVNLMLRYITINTAKVFFGN